MSSNITIEVSPGSQTARITVPLDIITGVDSKANAAAFARFTAELIKDTAGSRTITPSTIAASTTDSNTVVTNQNEDVNADDASSAMNTTVTELAKDITVYIRTLIGKEFPITASTSDTVGDVKDKISDKDGMPSVHQRLIFAGRNMSDSKPLHKYGVTDGAVLHLLSTLRGS